MPHALIIGASRGIGLELARQYLADGWEVSATARTAAALTALDAMGATPCALDVTDAASVEAFGRFVSAARYDVAMHVAGVMERGDASTAPSVTAFDAVMHANVLGAMRIIPIVAPRVAAARGCFGFISSLLGSVANADSSVTWLYRVSKSALNMAVRAARQDYPGATLVLLSPGWVRTDMGGASAPVSVADSVTGLRRVVASLSPEDTGTFRNYEGRTLPW